MTAVAWGWRTLPEPRAAVAMLAQGRAARSLAEAALRQASHGGLLRAAGSPDHLLVLGGADHLPWVDGASYLGEEAGLLLPTTLAPDLPADLVRRALVGRGPATELVLVPDRVLTFAAPAGPVDPDWLRAYAGGNVA